MKLHAVLLSAFLLSACLVTGAHGANLVTNGSFEQGALGIGSFEGWQTNLGDISTYVDSSGKTGPLYGEAFDGLWAAYFGSISGDGGASISQSLATNTGQAYVLTFELANDNGGSTPSNSFDVMAGNAAPFSFNNLADQPYVVYQYTFLASGSQTPLTFSGSNDNSYFELDDVAVTAVPEPSSITLFIAASLLSLLVTRCCKI
jgi:hypothetical protein